MKEMVYDPKIKNVILLDSGTYKGIECFIVNDCGLYPLAYIKIPDTLKISCYNPFKIDLGSPHGGITFVCKNDIPPLLEGVASKGDYLGWDYAHLNDYVGNNYYNYNSELFHLMPAKKWTTKEILEHVKNTIEEIRNAER